MIHDRGDRQTPWADSARLVASLPDARLVTTDGLGHRRILEDAGVVHAVTSFLIGTKARRQAA